MRQSTRNKLLTELADIINQWLGKLDCLDMPYMPDAAAFLDAMSMKMANNAILVLDLTDRAEQSLRNAGMIKEDE